MHIWNPPNPQAEQTTDELALPPRPQLQHWAQQPAEPLFDPAWFEFHPPGRSTLDRETKRRYITQCWITADIILTAVAVGEMWRRIDRLQQHAPPLRTQPQVAGFLILTAVVNVLMVVAWFANRPRRAGG